MFNERALGARFAAERLSRLRVRVLLSSILLHRLLCGFFRFVANAFHLWNRITNELKLERVRAKLCGIGSRLRRRGGVPSRALDAFAHRRLLSLQSLAPSRCHRQVGGNLFGVLHRFVFARLRIRELRLERSKLIDDTLVRARHLRPFGG